MENKNTSKALVFQLKLQRKIYASTKCRGGSIAKREKFYIQTSSKRNTKDTKDTKDTKGAMFFFF